MIEGGGHDGVHVDHHAERLRSLLHDLVIKDVRVKHDGVGRH